MDSALNSRTEAYDVHLLRRPKSTPTVWSVKDQVPRDHNSCGDEVPLIVSADGFRPDPEKVNALSKAENPKSKEKLTSFICMLQANSVYSESATIHNEIERTYEEERTIHMDIRT